MIFSFTCAFSFPRIATASCFLPSLVALSRVSETLFATVKRKRTLEPGMFSENERREMISLRPLFFPPSRLSIPSFPCFGKNSQPPPLKKKNKKTKKTSLFTAIPACLAFTFYTVSNEEHHAGEKPERTYTNVRSKPFPWGEDALFTKKGGHH